MAVRTKGSSFVDAALKKLLSLMYKLMPGSMYERVYAVAFAIYKALVRVWFLRFILVNTLSSNQEELRKAKLIYKVMPFSLVGWRGLSATYDAAVDLETRGLSGSFVECGVAQGGSAALLATISQRHGGRRKCLFFDSYEGLPSPTAEDFDQGSNSTGQHIRPLPPGSCLGTCEQVEGLLFEKFGLSRSNISLIKGWFENTIPYSRARTGPIALLRVDADWYSSTRICLDHCYDLVVPTGYVIIDDYGTCVGARKAVDEFLSERHLTVALAPDGRGGVTFRKPD